ncbi:EF-P lysine aminoacylase GenX [Candidatus Uhrbacteria bacterium]|nr:EF-P lysine aminoacylase GenX [Candidatus Uhrbacteria bacterium]
MDIEKLKARSAVIKLIRRWFDERGFTEMHTPRLVGLPGQEPYLEPFWTEVIEESGPHHPAALITSPEYMMKRILATGLDRIYDLGPCFRNNEPWDGTHDPEFLMLEWYRRDSGLEDLMRDTEEMVKWVIEQFVVLNEGRQTAEVEGPFKKILRQAQDDERWRRLTVEQAWREYCGIELAPVLEDREAMAQVCRDRGQSVVDDDTWDDLYFKIFLSEIEPKLGEVPTFLHRYPASMSALARKSSDDPRWADRVELYIGDYELANGFAELSDPVEQHKRFEEEQLLRQSLGKKSWPIDETFIAALPQMGNAAGIAFGVERLVMLLTGSDSINDILPSSARERFSS